MKEEPATGSCWFWYFSGTNKFVTIKRSMFDHSIPNTLSGRKKQFFGNENVAKYRGDILFSGGENRKYVGMKNMVMGKNFPRFKHIFAALN